MVDLDHVAVAALISRFADDAIAGSYDDLAALTIDIHAGMKLIGASAKRISPEAEFIVDLRCVRPDRRQVCRIGRTLDRLHYFLELRTFGIEFFRIYRPTGV